MTDPDGTCAICGDPAPIGARGQQRLTCDKPECRRARAQYSVSRRRAAIQARRERLAGKRTCQGPCGRTLPLDSEHFPYSNRDTGHVYYRRVCRQCWNTIYNVENCKRYKLAVQADPDRHTRHLQAERMRYRARRERETGAMPRASSPKAAGAYRPLGNSRGERRLDPQPLREWLETVLADEQHAEGFEFTTFCQTLGIHDRQLRAIRHGEYRTVGLHVADRLLTGYGRPVVIRSKDLERRLIQWAQSLPGNGARLLAYMDRAEAVAHLADVAVLRVDDLYPELDT